MYTKCQNINRTPGGSTSGSSTAPAPKRRKVDDLSKHLYPSLTAGVEDPASNERNRTQLKKELEKTKPSKDVLTELMKRTFGSRRNCVLDEAVSIKEICVEYPLLKRSAYVSQCLLEYMGLEFHHLLMQVAMEFDMIMHTELSREKFEKSWTLWGQAIVDYARAMRNPPLSLKRTFQEILMMVCCSYYSSSHI